MQCAPARMGLSQQSAAVSFSTSPFGNTNTYHNTFYKSGDFEYEIQKSTVFLQRFDLFEIEQYKRQHSHHRLCCLCCYPIRFSFSSLRTSRLAGLRFLRSAAVQRRQNRAAQAVRTSPVDGLKLHSILQNNAMIMCEKHMK